MKEIFNFLGWQWRKFEGWQKMFIFSMFLQGLALPMSSPWALWVSGLGLFIISAYLFKWAIWDGTRAAWDRYKKERNGLLDTIKNS